MVFILNVKIDGIHKINDIFHFLKKLMKLRHIPDYILLVKNDKPDSKILEIISLRWLYLASITDFFIWASSILEKNDNYTEINNLTYHIHIHYTNVSPDLKIEIEQLRTLMTGL